ncbi:MAG: dNTP triphosphohydrolase [Duncaniella sp.]|nr:dNTP triphosphohydrolase [Muribaculum sp.]MCM1255798.1 dNTP triphosphohydrolase [Duncaniella sp.]
MSWDKLINDKRFGLEHYHDGKPGHRSDFQRDFDRLVFSSPFRRLQNKTQVFPLPGSIFVHNRLTHSMEVACVGRSLAKEISILLKERYASMPWVAKLDDMGEIVAAACLAHDLGNPPFGHSGEKAISAYFSEGNGRYLESKLTPQQWNDLIHFEGNANAFRLLTHQFNGRRPGGFAMTYSTLASIVKYPFESSLAGSHGKFGFFTAEKDDFIKVADELGMLPITTSSGAICYKRHPLVYIVEAADDICYEVMDIEDAHKLGTLTTNEVIPLFLAFFDEERRKHIEKIMQHVEDPNEKIAYLRSSIIGILVSRCAEAFVENEDNILSGTFRGSLLDNISPRERNGYKACEALSWQKIYGASDVVDIELAGTRIISFLINELVEAVQNPELNYSRLLLAKVPTQYEINSPTLYGKLLAVLDHISGMTDVYALDLYRKLNGMSLKINN